MLTQHHLGQTVTRHTQGIECYGAYILNGDTGAIETFLSRVTMMATGGIGAVYQTTTNPDVATGDGIAMVARAKGEVKGMEFVQFHPTALTTRGTALFFDHRGDEGIRGDIKNTRWQGVHA